MSDWDGFALTSVRGLGAQAAGADAEWLTMDGRTVSVR